MEKFLQIYHIPQLCKISNSHHGFKIQHLTQNRENHMKFILFANKDDRGDWLSIITLTDLIIKAIVKIPKQKLCKNGKSRGETLT